MNLENYYKEHTTRSSDGCILWHGAKNSKGYGAIRIGKKTFPAHRVYYEFFTKTKIPVGMVIDHLCRTPACVNISHLELTTYSENTIRGIGFNKTKTHCKSGHEFTEENTYLYKGKYRRCKKCIKFHSLHRN